MFKLEAQGCYLEVPQAEQEATSTDKPITNRSANISETGYRCVCLNARGIVNKKTNELNIMVEDIDPNRIGRRGEGVILYVKESIQAYEIKLKGKQNVMKLFGAK